MLRSRSRAALLAVTLALIALGIGGWQKYWRIWGRYTPEEIAEGKTRPFFTNVRLHTYLAELTRDEWESKNPHRRQNLINVGLVTGPAVAVGLLTFWLAAPRRRPRPVADYAEARGESVPDGRRGQR
jgi:hypothetical protein